jgi:hypothetical protein
MCSNKIDRFLLHGLPICMWPTQIASKLFHIVASDQWLVIYQPPAGLIKMGSLLTREIFKGEL